METPFNNPEKMTIAKNKKHHRITVREFKRITDGGFDFYRFVMRQYGVELKRGHNFQIRNPFYKDTNPALEICPKNGEYLFHDFGDNNYEGDVIVFAGLYYKLDYKKDLPQILERACMDLKLNITDERFSETIEHSTLIEGKNDMSNINVKENNHPINIKDFSNFEKNYWLQYGIDTKILDKFLVKSLASFSLKNKNGEENNFFSTPNNPIFVYIINELCFKIYRPYDKNYKFFYIGKKPKDYIFGLGLLPENGETLFITAGEKDVMTLTAFGYNAITLNSETANLDNNLLEELQSRFRYIIILYDIDETGLKQSEKISKENNLKRIVLPDELLKRGLGKDISDYFKTGISFEHSDFIKVDSFDLLIKEVIENSYSKQEVDKTELFNIQFLPNSIFNNLPSLLQKICKVFDNQIERDIVLLGSIGVLSACMNNVFGIYHSKKVKTNLFIFIIAPSGAGKGVLAFCKRLGMKIHKDKIQINNQKKIQYEQELEKYNSKKNNNNFNDTKPEKPKQELFFIPANSSATGAFELLNNNDGKGMIFESEGDTLSNTFKTDYGNYSDGLRKAFHHESISYYRRMDKEYIEIEEPCLSVVLSGTPGQLQNLIPSVENGLYSRFLYYYIDIIPIFKDVFSEKQKNLNDYFDKIGVEVSDLYSKFSNQKVDIEFELTTFQEKKFVTIFEKWHEEFNIFWGIESLASARRLALICFRIAMIITVLRSFRESDVLKNMVCSDIDYEIAIEIVRILKEHSLLIFNQLPKSTVFNNQNNKVLNLYEKLPENFQRDEGVKIASELGISRPTFDRIIKKNLFKKIGHGLYKKIKLSI